MLIFLFALWLILNGRITAEICLIGVALSGAVYAFCVFVLGYKLSDEKVFWKRLPHYVGYFFCLIVEIYRANLTVIQTILAPKAQYTPAIVHLRIPLRENISRVLLASSITLTPGTVTVAQTGNDFLVLCLDKQSADGIAAWCLTDRLRKMEESK